MTTKALGNYVTALDYAVVTLKGFGAGPHTVRVTVSGAGTATVLGLLVGSPTPPVIAWVKEGASTYWGAGNNVATYNTLLANTYLPEMATVLPDFPNCVAVSPGAGWDAATMLGPDGIHPKRQGQRLPR